MTRPAKNSPPLAAAIDVGSNAFRLIVGARAPDGSVSVLENYREPIRLGTDVFRRGILSQKTIREALSAFDRFKLILKRHRIETVRAVGTSALRESKNGSELIAKIKRRTGIQLEIISGDEEARLIHVAVKSAVNLNKRLALLIDIGGGSVELTFVAGGAIVATESVKMGAVRLLQLLEQREQGEKIFNRLAESYINGLERRLKRQLGKRRVSLCIGTGGNVEAFGDLRVLLGKGQDRNKISRRELEKLCTLLRRMSVEDRVKVLGLKPDRADVVVPAMLIMGVVMRFVGATELQIPRVGLKDGILIDLFANQEVKGSEARQAQLLEYSLEVGRKYLFDEAHARLVAKLSVEFFDDLKARHKLGIRERQLLEVAAVLHDIGQFIQYANHHKHSFYIIMNSPIVGLSPREKVLVAFIARYHRKSTPQKNHVDFMALSKEDRECIRKLVAILRIADALDCSHTGRVRGLTATVRAKKFEIEFGSGPNSMLLERWAVQRKGELFEEVIGLKLLLK